MWYIECVCSNISRSICKYFKKDKQFTLLLFMFNLIVRWTSHEAHEIQWASMLKRHIDVQIRKKGKFRILHDFYVNISCAERMFKRSCNEALPLISRKKMMYIKHSCCKHLHKSHKSNGLYILVRLKLSKCFWEI